MRHIILACVFLFSFFQSFSQFQSLESLDEGKILSKKTAKLFKENKISDAVKLLQPYWPLPENEINSFEEKTIKYINIVENKFGKGIGYTKVKEEKIKDFAFRETYIVRYSYSAIRLIFTFYKNNNGWIINSFKWDDSFEEEFK